MCKLILGIQKNKSAEFADLIQAQAADLKRENDGVAAMVVYSDGKLEVERHLGKSFYDETLAWLDERISKAYFVVVHTRTSSSGSKNLENVHLFNDNGLYFAHNGFVTGALKNRISEPKEKKKEEKNDNGEDTQIVLPGVSTYRRRVMISDEAEYDKLIDVLLSCADCFNGTVEVDGYTTCKKHEGIKNRLEKLEDNYNGIYSGIDSGRPKHMGFGINNNSGLCDSHEFLKLCGRENKITKEVLSSLADANEFRGVATLYDSNEKKMYLMVDKEIHSVSDDKNYNLIFSYKPEMDIERYKTFEAIGGVSCYTEERVTLEREDRGVYNGIHVLSLPEKLKVEKK